MIYTGICTINGNKKNGRPIKADMESRTRISKVNRRLGTVVGVIGSRLRGSGRAERTEFVRWDDCKRE
jgi:hypothetical protein